MAESRQRCRPARPVRLQKAASPGSVKASGATGRWFICAYPAAMAAAAASPALKIGKLAVELHRGPCFVLPIARGHPVAE